MIQRVSEKNEPIILIIVPYEKSTVQLTGTGEVIHIGKEPKVFVLEKWFALERNQIVRKGFFLSFFLCLHNERSGHGYLFLLMQSQTISKVWWQRPNLRLPVPWFYYVGCSRTLICLLILSHNLDDSKHKTLSQCWFNVGLETSIYVIISVATCT